MKTFRLFENASISPIASRWASWTDKDSKQYKENFKTVTDNLAKFLMDAGYKKITFDYNNNRPCYIYIDGVRLNIEVTDERTKITTYITYLLREKDSYTFMVHGKDLDFEKFKTTIAKLCNKQKESDDYANKTDNAEILNSVKANMIVEALKGKKDFSEFYLHSSVADNIQFEYYYDKGKDKDWTYVHVRIIPDKMQLRSIDGLPILHESVYLEDIKKGAYKTEADKVIASRNKIIHNVQQFMIEVSKIDFSKAQYPKVLICGNCKNYWIAPVEKCSCGCTTLSKTHPYNAMYAENKNQ